MYESARRAVALKEGPVLRILKKLDADEEVEVLGGEPGDAFALTDGHETAIRAALAHRGPRWIARALKEGRRLAVPTSGVINEYWNAMAKLLEMKRDKYANKVSGNAMLVLTGRISGRRVTGDIMNPVTRTTRIEYWIMNKLIDEMITAAAPGQRPMQDEAAFAKIRALTIENLSKGRPPAAAALDDDKIAAKKAKKVVYNKTQREKEKKKAAAAAAAGGAAAAADEEEAPTRKRANAAAKPAAKGKRARPATLEEETLQLYAGASAAAAAIGVFDSPLGQSMFSPLPGPPVDIDAFDMRLGAASQQNLDNSSMFSLSPPRLPLPAAATPSIPMMVADARMAVALQREDEYVATYDSQQGVLAARDYAASASLFELSQPAADESYDAHNLAADGSYGALPAHNPDAAAAAGHATCGAMVERHPDDDDAAYDAADRYVQCGALTARNRSFCVAHNCAVPGCRRQCTNEVMSRRLCSLHDYDSNGTGSQRGEDNNHFQPSQQGLGGRPPAVSSSSRRRRCTGCDCELPWFDDDSSSTACFICRHIK